jgi:hypothetical protein
MYKTQAKALGGMPMLTRIIRCYHRFWDDAEPYWAASIDEPETRKEKDLDPQIEAHQCTWRQDTAARGA